MSLTVMDRCWRHLSCMGAGGPSGSQINRTPSGVVRSGSGGWVLASSAPSSSRNAGGGGRFSRDPTGVLDSLSVRWKGLPLLLLP